MRRGKERKRERIKKWAEKGNETRWRKERRKIWQEE